MQEINTEKKASKKIEERTLVQGLLYYISVILQYKWMIIIISILGILGSVGFSIMTLKLPIEKNPMPNVYTADAVLLVEDQGSDMSDLMATMGYASANQGSSPIELALEIMKSRKFLDDIIQFISLEEILTKNNNDIIQSDLRDFLKDNVQYYSSSKSSKIAIYATTTDPILSRDIVNAYVDKLQNWFYNSGGLTSENQIRNMEQTLLEMNAKISKLEYEIEEFQKKYEVLTVEELSITQNTLINDMRTQLVALDQEINDYESFSRVEDSTLKRMKSRKKGLVSLIGKIENGYDGNRYSLPSKEELPELSRQFAKKRTDLEIQMRLYQTVAERYEVTKLANTSESPFYILQKAEIPEKKSGPNRSELCIMVTLGAFFFAIALSIFLNILKTTLSNPENVKIIKGARK